MQRIHSLFSRLFSTPISAQRFFLLLGFPLSICLIVLIPPFQAPDEGTHFYKAVFQSRGHILAQVLPSPNRVGYELPAKYRATAAQYDYIFPSSKLDFAILHKDLSEPISKNKLVPTNFENTAQYAPLAYIPQTIAIFITHFLTGSVLLQMYAARFATSITWILLTFLAIRCLPFAKWGAIALALTPLSLFLSASCSNDAITFGLCLLFIALVLRAIASKKKLTNQAQVQILLSGLALGLCKPPYLLLVLLAIAIPVRSFASKRSFWVFLIKILGGAFLFAFVWAMLARKITLNWYGGSDNAEQLKFILHNPLFMAKVLIRDMFINPYGNDMIVQIIGLKSWVAANTPLWVIWLSYLLLLVGTTFTVKAQRARTLSSPMLRYISMCIFIVGLFAIWLLLYITYTPVGFGTVIGVNGRYFIPFIYLTLPLLGGNAGIRLMLSDRAFRLLKIGLIVVAVSVLPSTISRFY